MSDPCLRCGLPDCDDADPRCAVLQAQRARKRAGNPERVARYRARHPIRYHAAQIAWQRDRRIDRIARQITRRATAWERAL